MNPGETELDHTHLSILLAVAHKRHHNLGASWVQRNFFGSKMRPLEVEYFSGAVITSITVHYTIIPPLQIYLERLLHYSDYILV